MPEDTTDRATGLGQFPKTAADLAELEREATIREKDEIVAVTVDAAHRNGITVSMSVDGAGAAEAYGFNGRETAAWVLGQWQRHYREAADRGFDFNAEDAWFELLAKVKGDHLPAVAAIMLRSGVAADIWNSETSGALTLRLSFRR